MNKQHILILVGISGSGKTTLARQMCNDPNYIRVNRDDLRSMLFGYTDKDMDQYYLKKGIQFRESLVTNVQDKAIREGLKAGKNVIVDNTNLKYKYIKHFEKYGMPLDFKILDVDVSLAISRDKDRVRKVGEEIIMKQFVQFKKIKEKLDGFDN